MCAGPMADFGRETWLGGVEAHGMFLAARHKPLSSSPKPALYKTGFSSITRC